MSFTRSVALTLFVATLAACSRSQTPVAPSGAVTSSVAAAGAAPASPTGASITGLVLGGPSAHSLRPSGASLTISVVGTPLAAGLDSTGRFSIDGVPAGNVTLSFTGNGVSATLPLGAVVENQRINLTVTVTASNASLESQEVVSGNHLEAEGVIAGLSGSCPTISFTINGKTFKTDGSTRFDAAPCANVRNGDRVEAGGSLQTDGTVLAAKVEANNGQAHAGDNNETENENEPADNHTNSGATNDSGSHDGHDDSGSGPSGDDGKSGKH